MPPSMGPQQIPPMQQTPNYDNVPAIISSSQNGVRVKLSNVDRLPKAQFSKTINSLLEISNRQQKDFPYTVKLDISGLKIPYKLICSPYSFCNTLIETPCDNGYSICLPYDSSKSNLQPPIELASILSCANVNDEEITNSYMQLFGLKSCNGSLIKPIHHNSIYYPIIQLYTSEGTDIFKEHNVEPLNTEEQVEFIENFRKIASSPVGRVLLYRLAIELLRYNTDNKQYCDANIENRGNARGIWIGKCKQLDSDAFCHLGNEKLQSIIRLSPRTTQQAKQVKSSTVNLDGLKVIANDTVITADVILFHELLHWFHYLQSQTRQAQIRNNSFTNQSYELKAYYGDIPSDLLAWGNIRVEELMTIAGKPDYNDQEILKYILENAFRNEQKIGSKFIKDGYICDYEKFLDGDELSENAYRLAKRLTDGYHVDMRWGHGSVKSKIQQWDSYIKKEDCASTITRLKLANVVAKRCVSDIINAGKPEFCNSSDVIGFLNN